MGRYTSVQAYADNNRNVRSVPYEQATGSAEPKTGGGMYVICRVFIRGSVQIKKLHYDNSKLRTTNTTDFFPHTINNTHDPLKHVSSLSI